MIRLIATDVDKTLIREGTGYLNPEYYAVIRALKKKGVFFIAASGRHMGSLSALFTPVADEIGMISSGGAVYSIFGEQHVVSALTCEEVLGIEEDVKKIPDAAFVADTPDSVLMHPGNEQLYRFLTEGYGNRVELTDGFFPPEKAYVKVAIYHPNRIEEATREIVRKWSGQVHLCFAGDVWLDGLSPQCNKGNALACIQERLGISVSETIAFGDNGNDLEMLSRAGISYAVAGARPEVKRAVTHVIGPWEEDSVLRELKTVLKKLS